MITRRMTVAAGLAGLAAACAPEKKAAAGRTAIRFATDWRAEAEHGGFYQALATGEYAKRGLDVTLIQGGPAVNVPQLLGSEAIEMGVGSNGFIGLNLAIQKVPAKAVAAFFQKDPQVLIAHPDAGIKSLADIKGHPVLLADASRDSFWPWLRARFGYTDDQIRKYNYSVAPFLADKSAVVQGYVTSEPYTIEKEGALKPSVFLLADAGYPSYACMALAHDKLIANNPKAVQAFVDASVAGWKSYLYGDARAADALILKDNPEMTADTLAQARDKLKSYGIVSAGPDAPIGQMTDERWTSFLTAVSAQDPAHFPKDTPIKSAYTLQFLK
jgi:NitT/TauT family transport system substrate-binding protein